MAGSPYTSGTEQPWLIKISLVLGPLTARNCALEIMIVFSIIPAPQTTQFLSIWGKKQKSTGGFITSVERGYSNFFILT